MNCMFWILYGLPVVHPDSTLVVTINGVGLALELIYLKIVAIGLLGEVAFLGVIAVITFVVFHNTNTRTLFVGIICDIFNIIMYASPLSIWHKVIKTKSVEYMPFFLSLANFANGAVWTAYGLIKFDKFIVVSNGLGTVLGAIQLIIYGCYYKSTPKKGSGDVIKPNEVQLSGATIA
ncbi:Bidirectional sugar transporter SWEET6b [Citrus sinensis]|nr:Bidirectional sugar transporter SWEET6b [Citrus sinensis]